MKIWKELIGSDRHYGVWLVRARDSLLLLSSAVEMGVKSKPVISVSNLGMIPLEGS